MGEAPSPLRNSLSSVLQERKELPTLPRSLTPEPSAGTFDQSCTNDTIGLHFLVNPEGDIDLRV